MRLATTPARTAEENNGFVCRQGVHAFFKGIDRHIARPFEGPGGKFMRITHIDQVHAARRGDQQLLKSAHLK